MLLFVSSDGPEVHTSQTLGLQTTVRCGTIVRVPDDQEGGYVSVYAAREGAQSYGSTSAAVDW